MATATNTNAENFGNVAGASVEITHASLTLTDSTKADRLLWTGALNTPRTLVLGDPMSLPMGDLDLDWPSGDFEDPPIKEALDLLLASYSTGVMMRLGTGAMGTAGTANEVTDTGYSIQRIELTTAAAA